MDTAQPLSLSVIDLCKRSSKRSAKQALEETLALAELVDTLGYKRYWVAEHHVEDTAEACPEVLVALIASRTKNIRVGSGGVLLRYYSPLKVAETFLTIEALYPGRIDLGVCKGPGAMPANGAALVSGNMAELGEDVFERKVEELIDYLRKAPTVESGGQDVVHAYPWGVTPPPVWVLGSGSKSMELATRLGTPYSFTLFFDPRQTYGQALMRDYHQKFVPSPENQAPRTSIAVTVICAEDEIEALVLETKSVGRGSLPTTVVGTPQHCIERLRELAVEYSTNEILIAVWMENYEARANVYRWLAELNQPSLVQQPFDAIASPHPVSHSS
jgi:luciferase family oxidoreductase group 1